MKELTMKLYYKDIFIIGNKILNKNALIAYT